MKREKSFLVYTDNRIGPGYYEPNLDYHLKKAPRPLVSKTKRSSLIDYQPAKKITIAELGDLMTGPGNMARKMKAAENQIKEYLSTALNKTDTNYRFANTKRN